MSFWQSAKVAARPFLGRQPTRIREYSQEVGQYRVPPGYVLVSHKQLNGAAAGIVLVTFVFHVARDILVEAPKRALIKEIAAIYDERGKEDTN